MANSQFTLYQYNPMNGWTLLSEVPIDGIQLLKTFELQQRDYLLVVGRNESKVISIFQQRA